MTADEYIQGTYGQDFQEYYASQGGVIQYSVAKKTGLISQANPGVFFYYTGLDGVIQGDGTPLVVTIDQSNDESILMRTGISLLSPTT